jgi:hypothetical protein
VWALIGHFQGVASCSCVCNCLLLESSEVMNLTRAPGLLREGSQVQEWEMALERERERERERKREREKSKGGVGKCVALHLGGQVKRCVRFEVLTAVVTKGTIFWDITPCSPLKANRRFGETSPSSRSKNKPARALFVTCFYAGFLLGLFFNPEDGRDMFLRNVGRLSTGYTALYPRR